MERVEATTGKAGAMDQVTERAQSAEQKVIRVLDLFQYRLLEDDSLHSCHNCSHDQSKQNKVENLDGMRIHTSDFVWSTLCNIRRLNQYLQCPLFARSWKCYLSNLRANHMLVEMMVEERVMEAMEDEEEYDSHAVALSL